MNQQTYDGIMNVLHHGSGVMAQEYCQAFSAVVSELQKRIQAENEAKNAKPETPKKEAGGK